MEDFLKKFQLSDSAIEIYMKSLGRSPQTFYELYSIVHKLPQEKFEEELTQLINSGLLIQLVPKKQEILLHYLAIPPIFPIINYYENITINLDSIKDSIHELMVNTVNQIFQKDNPVELDTILKTFQETREDINEDIMIQKQEIEDAVEGMEDLKQATKDLTKLSQQIKILTQTQFVNLMKKISNVNAEMAEEIGALDLKKQKKEVLDIIENKSKEKLDKMVQNFSKDLHEQIEEKFEGTIKPMGNLIDATFQYRDDFKLILLNILNNFETKINKIHDLIKQNKDTLAAEMNNLQIKIAENLNTVVQNSIDEVSGLNKPIENLMKNYYQDTISSEKLIIKDIWSINSLTKINEEIQKFISTANEELIIIIPRLENHLAIEQFDKINSYLKVKIVSSEPHTNSTVKTFKSITSLIYKTWENEKRLILKADKNQLAMGVLNQESKDKLNDFVGFGSDFLPLIELLNPIIQKVWDESYSDSFYGAQKTQTPTPAKPLEPKLSTTIKPITTPKFQSIKPDQEKPIIQEESKIVPQATPSTLPKQQQEIDKFKEKLQQKIESTTPTTRQTGDEAGIIIGTSFDNLIQKLHNLKAKQFSEELQKIADLVLEKRGFSVTLHKLRSTINQYRFSDNVLEANDVQQIIQDIQDWKKKLV
ncbi:MAG: hypothetical protein ACFE8N_00165 [Promethearchaeota archaeon]